MARYGYAAHSRTAHTEPFTVWSGAYMAEYVGQGTARDGARRATITTDCGARVTVKLPDGITFPRTDANYQAIDDAIADALSAA